ncbi:MAG: CPBP family intramembrane metalloprotease [Haliscomenobacter sp.]|nr:CPBP family intramembrane metalloprotease [Haliscomenobacter sp.]
MERNPLDSLEPSGPDWKQRPGIILALLLVGVLVGLGVGNTLAALVILRSGVDFQLLLQGLEEGVSRQGRDAMRLATLLNHICTFAGPALLVMIWAYREQWKQELRIHRSPNAGLLALGMLFLLLSFPVAQYLYWWNLKLPLPEMLADMERSANQMVKAFLVMDDPWELAFNVLTVGVVAALGEELVFRGVVQPKLGQLFRNEIAAVWFTALLFSTIHFQFAGFLPRMVLGAVLGYLFLWTRNLWIPFIAHFAFNALQIVAQYFYGDLMDQFDPETMKQPHWATFVLPMALLLLIGNEIQKRKNP